jgi:hypothetical protein
MKTIIYDIDNTEIINILKDIKEKLLKLLATLFVIEFIPAGIFVRFFGNPYCPLFIAVIR